MKVLPFSILGALTLATAARADDATYVLAREGSFPPGTKLVRRHTLDTKNGVARLGKDMTGTGGMHEVSEETDTFITADKVRVLLTASEKTGTLKVSGQEIPRPERPSELLNVPVTYTRTGDKWTGTPDTGTAQGRQFKEIAVRAKALGEAHDAEVYGTSPHKVGDAWVADAAKLPFAERGRKITGQWKITFKGIEEFEGKKCARLEGPVECVAEGGGTMTLKGNAVVLRSLDDLTDVKTEMTGRMTAITDSPLGKMELSGDLIVTASDKVSH